MITIFAGRNPNRCALHVAGHAGAAPLGEDVVCAAVSVLTQTLAMSLRVFELRGCRIRLRPGDARITCTVSGLADALFYQTILGLAQIARQYPEQVRLRTEGFFAGDEKEETA